jgi:WD40 repeat protein
MPYFFIDLISLSIPLPIITTRKTGAYIVLSSHDFKIVHEGKDSNEPIRIVKFSPDGKQLAVGSEDATINIYNVKDRYSRRSTINSHKSPVFNIDFSADGQFVMSIDSTSRICYSEASSG